MREQTPGPWKVVKCSCGHKFCDRWFIEHVVLDGITGEANARLITAAPDLLKAATAVVKPSNIIGIDDALQALKAAIAKAEGEI
uniref:Uncharacterized protein n=1 Tax=viral metagenome TaxID=1070528 RepID=A0A6M3LTG3_9ZZZZ